MIQLMDDIFIWLDKVYDVCALLAVLFGTLSVALTIVWLYLVRKEE
jgi:hypothetical protein